jgi:hypothetical protein
MNMHRMSPTVITDQFKVNVQVYARLCGLCGCNASFAATWLIVELPFVPLEGKGNWREARCVQLMSMSQSSTTECLEALKFDLSIFG